MCHRQRSLSSDAVFERIWRDAVQDIIENAKSNQRAKTRNQKRFRRWKRRSLMKKQQNMQLRQRKGLNGNHCEDHCLQWIELNQTLAKMDPNTLPLNTFCCCSNPFPITQYLHLLMSKRHSTSQSLKSVVR